jgi:hypothetical protein
MPAAREAKPAAWATSAQDLCKDWADSDMLRVRVSPLYCVETAIILGRNRAMRLLIEILAAAVLIFCITATSAAFAQDKPGGKMGRSADGFGCGISLPQNAAPAARCAAIRRQCGGKFYANYCGGRMLSAVN